MSASVTKADSVSAVAPPAMPASLEQLVSSVLSSLDAVPVQRLQPTPEPVPTAQLLQQIDELYAAYITVVDLTCQSLRPGAAESTTDAQEIAAATDALEARAAAIQAGIRSKVQQAARIAMIEHLREEVAQRRAIVEKMEGTLSVAKKYL